MGAVEVVHEAWAEVVFHVLAHVPGDAPASLWEPRYVRWAEARLGPASGRCLGDDAGALAALASSHEALVSAQLVAWLFRDPARARRASDRALADLAPEDVDAPWVLEHLRGTDAATRAAAELLFCAAALEAEVVARLPAVARGGALGARVMDLVLLAPALASSTLGVVRALGWRGRVLRRAIWVGAPEAIGGGPSAEHVAWQAAHEAVVAEVTSAGRAGHATTEHVAVVLLAERARRAGLAEPHARWLSTLRAPSAERSSLGAEGASLLASVSAPAPRSPT